MMDGCSLTLRDTDGTNAEEEAGDAGAGDGSNEPQEAPAEASPSDEPIVFLEWVKHNMESSIKDTTQGGARQAGTPPPLPSLPLLSPLPRTPPGLFVL